MINKALLFKYRMLEKDLTQRELADRLNISYNTINTWIVGETPNNIAQYLKFLSILDVSLDEIEDKIIMD